MLGNLILLEGDVARARDLQQQSLVLRREIGDLVGVRRSLDALGWIAQVEAASARAAALFGAADALRERVGAAANPPGADSTRNSLPRLGRTWERLDSVRHGPGVAGYRLTRRLPLHLLPPNPIRPPLCAGTARFSLRRTEPA